MGEVYCYCRKPDPEDGSTMVFCEKCEEWYHDSCIFSKDNIKQAQNLSDDWECPTCLSDWNHINIIKDRIKKHEEEAKSVVIRSSKRKRTIKRHSDSEDDSDSDVDIPLASIAMVSSPIVRKKVKVEKIKPKSSISSIPITTKPIKPKQILPSQEEAWSKVNPTIQKTRDRVQALLTRKLNAKLAIEIEEEMFAMFPFYRNIDIQKEYTQKSRDLSSSLTKDNQQLVDRVLSGKISPKRLCTMTTEEMAPLELQAERRLEREAALKEVIRDEASQLEDGDLGKFNASTMLKQISMQGEAKADETVDVEVASYIIKPELKIDSQLSSSNGGGGDILNNITSPTSNETATSLSRIQVYANGKLYESDDDESDDINDNNKSKDDDDNNKSEDDDENKQQEEEDNNTNKINNLTSHIEECTATHLVWSGMMYKTTSESLSFDMFQISGPLIRKLTFLPSTIRPVGRIKLEKIETYLSDVIMLNSSKKRRVLLLNVEPNIPDDASDETKQLYDNYLQSFYQDKTRAAVFDYENNKGENNMNGLIYLIPPDPKRLSPRFIKSALHCERPMDRLWALCFVSSESLLDGYNTKPLPFKSMSVKTLSNYTTVPLQTSNKQSSLTTSTSNTNDPIPNADEILALMNNLKGTQQIHRQPQQHQHPPHQRSTYPLMTHRGGPPPHMNHHTGPRHLNYPPPPHHHHQNHRGPPPGPPISRFDQRPPPRGPPQEICRSYLQGRCKYGDGCRHRHIEGGPPREDCRDFIRGKCRRGDRCPHRHILPGSRRLSDYPPSSSSSHMYSPRGVQSPPRGPPRSW